jgi:hypothetical protein
MVHQWCTACCGRICFDDRKVNLSQVFAGQTVGIREVGEKIWLVSFMNYDLGFFDSESGRVECTPNPFDDKVSPMCPEWTACGGRRHANVGDLVSCTLWLLWQCIRLPLYVMLAILEPVVSFILRLLALLGVLTALFWKLENRSSGSSD